MLRLSRGLVASRAVVARAVTLRAATAIAMPRVIALPSWMTPAASSSAVRAFAADAKADAKDPDAPLYPKFTPEERKVRRAAKKAAHKAKRAASFGHDPKKLWLGPRWAVETERSEDLRRFKREMHEMRKAYKEDYDNKKRVADEARAVMIQNELVSRAEANTKRMNEKRLSKERSDILLAKALDLKERRRIRGSKILADRRRAAEGRRGYQMEQLRKEMKNWVTSPSEITENFFEDTVSPPGFWPTYTEKKEAWETAVMFTAEENEREAKRNQFKAPSVMPRAAAAAK